MANAPSSNHPRFWQRIQGRLILLLLTILLPTLLIQAYVYYERVENRRAEELHSNLELARAASQAFETFVNDIIHQELSIGLALTSSQPLTVEDQNRILNGSKSGNSAIWHFFWDNPAGVVVAATGSQFIGMDISDREFYREIVAGKDWIVSDLLLSKTTQRPSFTISRGIRNERGELLGIVVAGILPEQLDHILAIKRSEGGGHALVDRKGMMVYRYPALDHLTWEQRNWLRDYPEFGVALSGNEISKSVFAPFEGKNRLVAFTPVSLIGWAASAGRTEEIAMRPIFSRLLPQVVLLLIVTLAAFGIALLLARFISVPVKRLRDHALALGQGETSDPTAVSGPAELRELAGSFNEMAERLMAREASLRDQREWLGVTLASIGDAVLATDTEGRVSFLNPVASDLIGWKLEEAVGQPVQNIFRVIDEQTRRPAEDIVSRVVREGCVIALANHTALITRDEREIAIEDSAAPILDGTGNLIGVVLVFHDVSEKRRAQDALKRSEERFRVAQELSPDGFSILRPVRDADERVVDFTWVYANAATERIVGMKLPALAGRSLLELFPGHRGSSILEAYRQVAETGQTGVQESLYQGDGVLPQRWFRVAVVSMGQDIAVLSHDITERKQMEEELRKSRDELGVRVQERTAELNSYMAKLEQSNQALQDFASIAAHDLKEPLRKVISFGDMLRQKCGDSLGQSGNDYLDRMLNATGRMQSLLTGLLDYSRVATAAEPLKEVDLSDLIGGVLSDLEARIVKTGGEVHVGNLPAISADPTQMRQLFQNLIGNGLKFHKEGEKPIIRVSGSTSDDGNLQIIVEDNGIGFDEQFIEKIFAPFQRLHGRSSQYEGTGMGLAICKKIVERHGGSITASSEPGTGSTFIITLAQGRPTVRKG